MRRRKKKKEVHDDDFYVFAFSVMLLMLMLLGATHPTSFHKHIRKHTSKWRNIKEAFSVALVG